MIPENKKREMRFSVLSLLKENGMPVRYSEEDEEETPELLALTESEDSEDISEEEKARREEAKKRQEEAKKKQESKGPKLSPRGVDIMKSAFKKQM